MNAGSLAIELSRCCLGIEIRSLLIFVGEKGDRVRGDDPSVEHEQDHHPIPSRRRRDMATSEDKLAGPTLL